MPRRRAMGADRKFIDRRPEVGDHLVKSAERVMNILELLGDLSFGATVADIADKLKIPQSSTSALLRSLHNMGYLSYGREDRAYAQTGRVALLGHALEPQLVEPGLLLRMAQDLASQIGVNAFLATRNRLHTQIINVAYGYGPNPVTFVAAGSGKFLTSTAIGHALLSSLSDTEIVRLIVAINAQLGPQDAPVNSRQMLERIAQVREDGYAAMAVDSWEGQNSLAFNLALSRALREPMVQLCRK